jgi:hypothetical protein
MAIHIKKENRGKFNALKKRTGKSTEQLTHSKNPLTRKRAVFAQNARTWKHADGGFTGDPNKLYDAKTIVTNRIPSPITPSQYGYELARHGKLGYIPATDTAAYVNNFATLPPDRAATYRFPDAGLDITRAAKPPYKSAWPGGNRYWQIESQPVSRPGRLYSKEYQRSLGASSLPKMADGGLTNEDLVNQYEGYQKSIVSNIPWASQISSAAGTIRGAVDKGGVAGATVGALIDPSNELSDAFARVKEGKWDKQLLADVVFPAWGANMKRKSQLSANKSATNGNLENFNAFYGEKGGQIPNMGDVSEQYEQSQWGTPVELEGEEVFQTPQGDMGEVNGPSHAQGGVDMNLPPKTFVWSARLKSRNPQFKGQTFAKVAAKLGRDKAKYEKILKG